MKRSTYDNEGSNAFSRLIGAPEADLRGPIAFAGRKTGGQVSAYMQDSVQLTRGLTANIGLRFDQYSLATSAAHFSPRLNLAYRIGGTGTVLHASYDHFFAPPAVENVLISSAGLTRFLEDFFQPLPALKPIVENQFEIGITHPVAQRVHVGLSGYYRESDHPVHTVIFPDSRIYAYANFDKGKAYGMEIKTDAPLVDGLGLSAYLNYALSRVYLWNPVVAGFVEETHHVEEAGRFLAPMDQTHTLNAGFTYRHAKSGAWGRITFEYGSGTPTEAEETEGASMAASLRVPGHFTQNLTIGVDIPRRQERSRIGLQFNVENLSNNVYKVAQESVFSPGEYFNPRFFSGSMKIHF
jgi:outer membrane receptor protein involved in Fe transport